MCRRSATFIIIRTCVRIQEKTSNSTRSINNWVCLCVFVFLSTVTTKLRIRSSTDSVFCLSRPVLQAPRVPRTLPRTQTVWREQTRLDWGAAPRRRRRHRAAGRPEQGRHTGRSELRCFPQNPARQIDDNIHFIYSQFIYNFVLKYYFCILQYVNFIIGKNYYLHLIKKIIV